MRALASGSEPLPDDPLECPPSRSAVPERGVEGASNAGAGGALAVLLNNDASPAPQLLELIPESERAAVRRFPVQPRVLVNGQRKAFNAPAFLVERGVPISLTVEFEMPMQAKGDYDESRVSSCTVIRKVSWRGGETDRVAQASDGSTSIRLLATDGRSSDVTVEVAELRLAAGQPPMLLSGSGAFTLIPGLRFDRSGDGMLEGNPIGVYPLESGESAPSIVRDHARAYAPPRLFYRLDESSKGAILAPHVTMWLLNPPAVSGDPDEARYIAFDQRMERFWTAFNQVTMEEGYDAHGLRVLRGFVSPNDRARLARQNVEISEFSRHLYGDAVAIVLDTNEDTYMSAPRMADINKDGRADLADVEVLASLAEKTMEATDIWGGVGICGAFEGPGPSTGTPYLHIDLRGWHVPFREE